METAKETNKEKIKKDEIRLHSFIAIINQLQWSAIVDMYGWNTFSALIGMPILIGVIQLIYIINKYKRKDKIEEEK